MARTPRKVVPGQALSVKARGDQRRAVFFSLHDERHQRDALPAAALTAFLLSTGADAAQQAYLTSSYQSWVGYGVEGLERIELCLPQTLQPFPLPEACFPPGPYDYTSIGGVFHVSIHSPVPAANKAAGRLYTESVYKASDGRLISEGYDELYSYGITPVDDGCPSSAAYHFETQQCGEPVANRNAGKPLSCPLGNPINPATGNKYQREVDIDTTAGNGIEFARVYNYSTTEQGFMRNKVLGFGWSGSFLQSLHVFYRGAAEHVLLTRPDGKQLIFRQQGRQWLADADVHSVLEERFDADGLRSGWRHLTQQNETETYDVLGRLRSIADLRGKRYTLSYDYAGNSSSGHLHRVDANTGEFLLFGRDAFGRISAITDQAGRQWAYRYSNNSYSDSHLQYVDNPDGSTRQYHYEDPVFPHALTGITDERGIRYASYGYDAQGRAILSTHAGDAQRVDIVYHEDGTRTVINSLGQTSSYTTAVQLGVALVTESSGPGCSGCGGSNTRYHYDPASNNLLGRIEHGVSTRYGDYDAKGQPGYKIEAVGTPEERRTDYVYDTRFFNRITSRSEPSVNPAGSKVTDYRYDAFGNRTRETISGFAPDGSGGFVAVSRSTHWQYDGPLNQLSFIDGPRTDVNDFTTYRYYTDDAAEGNNRARLSQVEDADGVLIRYDIQYSATGKVLSESRPNNLTLSYSYYPGNDRLETLSEHDGISSRVTRWSYLETGEVKTITTGFGTPEATTITLGYDDARRLTRISDGSGNTIEYTLDTEGNRIDEKAFDAGGILKKQLSRSFDIYNRLDSRLQANESVDYDFAADGTLARQTDGNNVITDYRYDTLKRLTRVTRDLDGNDPVTANATTVYDYDTQDRLTSVTDPMQGNTRYVYDDLGNLVSQTSPDTGTTAFSYDEAGNLMYKIDANGQRLSYRYDALNRLISIDAPGSDDDVSYTYDDCLNGNRRLCGVHRGETAIAFTYTAFGEIAGSSQSVNSWPGIQQADIGLGYRYDSIGRLASVSYPGGAVVNYRYAAAGRLNAVDLNHDSTLTPLLSDMTYLPFGPVSRQRYGNDVHIFGWHDEAYRPWVIGNASVAYDVLDYDGNGNATSQFLQAGSHTYGYDALNRLSTAAGVFGSRDYTYDANGNRMRDSSGGLKTNYTYTPASNRLTGVGDEAVTVDANGNTTVLRGLRLGYSADNRLRSVAGVADYAYNGLGQRVQKATRASGSAGQYGFGPRRLFLYGRNGELLVESGPTGQVTREYVYANGTLLAILDRVPEGANDPLFNADRDGDGAISVEDFLEWYFNAYLMADDSLEVSGDGVMDADDASTVWACASVQNSCVVASHRTSIHYVHNDHLGTPMALTDESGAKVWSATYDPFGQATVNEDVDGNGEPVTLNIRFPGQYYDQETGLHYNYFRYYDSELGRYLTSDPIGLAGGTNTFAYVVNNPLKHIDPKGLDIWTGTMINVSLNVLVVGGSISYGHIINQSTGERCFVRVLCGRGGVGVGGGMGTRHTISGFSPLCGKNLDGFSFELSGEMLPPGGPGAGGSVGGGSGVGVGVSGRPGIGIGFFLGIDVCKLEVLRCFHSPCGCGS